MTPRFDNVIQLAEHAFTHFPDRPAFTCAGHTITYQELDQLSDTFSRYLVHTLGLKCGDRVAIQLPNILQFPIAFWGMVRAGLVVVNINPLYTPREVQHQLRDSGAKLLVVLSNIADNAAEIIDNTDVEHVIVTDFADVHPLPKRWIINAVIKHVKK